jgi:hypothetical protein
MHNQYRVTLHDPADTDVISDNPDVLYWTLDGLTPTANPSAMIESIGIPGRFIEATVRSDASFMVRYRESRTVDVQQIDDADILAVHQAIMACLSRADGWGQIFVPISGSFNSIDSDIDYQPTGLSIANTMLDHGKRRQRRNLPRVIPPMIMWGSRTVTTGDTWHDVPTSGRIAIHALHPDPAHEHGIAISAPRGTLTIGSTRPTPETIIWPTSSNPQAVVDYNAPARTLQVCNVYIVRGTAWERVDRWSENAGMLVEPVGKLERIYRCNHAATTPPGFTDLAFSMRLQIG